MKVIFTQNEVGALHWMVILNCIHWIE